MSAAPSDLSKSVFYLHLTSEIDAPIEKVWDTLTDLPKYHEWNPFVREMIIINEAKRKEGDQTLAVDKCILMTTRIPPLPNMQKVRERVTTVDRENRRLSWKNIDYPSWALRAERWQVLSSIITTTGNSNSVDGTEKTVTHYETWEAFDGVLAYLVRFLIGKSLKRAFGAFAGALKARCEG